MIEKLDFTENLTFGVEIEYLYALNIKVLEILKKLPKEYFENYISEWGYTLDYNFIELVDGLKNIYRGGEVKSRILTNNKECLSEIKFVIENLIKLEAKIDDRVSLHYHIGANILEENYKYLVNFLKIYTVYEHIIYKFSYNGKNPRSVITKYATPIRNRVIDILDNEFYNEYYNLIKELNFTFNYKKSGLNFENIDNNKKGLNTIEFRMSNASLDFETIYNELNVFCNLLIRSKREIDNEYLDYKIKTLKLNETSLGDYSTINEKDAMEFSNLIFNSDKSKERFMLQYIK